MASYLIFEQARGSHLNYKRSILLKKRPIYADKYQELFNCPINFGQKLNSYSFDEAYLLEPFPQADSSSNLIFGKQCEETCHQLEGKFSFSNLVRQYIQTNNGYECSLQSLAQKIHTTPRSIQRKLSAESTSFKVIQEDVRCNMAIEYLESTNMAVEEIADRLGYKEASSFGHAFKRWTGKPLGSYRQ